MLARVGVQCKIINLEYVECIWHPNTSTANYTFSSGFTINASHDCTEYILEHNYTIGCRIHLKSHELKSQKPLETTVFTEGNHTIKTRFDSLWRNVLLNPPYNLSLMWNEHNSTLLLQWDSSAPLTKKCAVYMVRIVSNQKDANQLSKVMGKSFSLSQVSKNKHYVFQVRSSVDEYCGRSDLWSNWSAPVEWGNAENVSRQGWWQWLSGILSVFLLLLLGLLLYFCERKRIILLPVVPDPSKNLQDLFYKHDGNVESWVHISKELKEAFEPDYTELSCDVSEVKSPCDAGPTPVSSPASQTDKCDEPSTEEEEPAEQQSS
ncbi:interleukin-5 receptor subunit alpha [Pimephales promelas]|nr:interleukin-5 receptor subunit alpha [Pimephales promelas]